MLTFTDHSGPARANVSERTAYCATQNVPTSTYSFIFEA